MISKLQCKEEYFLESRAPTCFTYNNDVFVYYLDNNINIYNKTTKEVKKFKYDSVYHMDIVENMLVIVAIDIFILDLAEFTIVNKFTNLKKNKAEMVKYESYKNKILLCRANNRLEVYEINNTDIKLVVTTTANAIASAAFLGEYYFGIAHTDGIFVFNYRGDKIVEKETEDPLGVFEYKKEIFVVSEDKIYDIFNNQTISIDTKITKDLLKGVGFMQEKVYLYTNKNVYEFVNKDFIEFYSNKDIIIANMCNNAIVTEEGDIIFLEGNNEIYTFNNNITNILTYKDNLILSTNTGRIKIGSKNNKNIFITDKIITVLETSPITAMKLIEHENTDILVIATSTDIFMLNRNDFSISNFIFENEHTLTDITSFDISTTHDLFCIGKDDGTILIGKNKKIIFTQQGSKTISAVKITNNFIVALSYDSNVYYAKIKDICFVKTFKLTSISFNKPTCIAFNNTYICIGGHKKFNIYDVNTFELIKSYSTPKLILSCFIFEKYFVTVTDVIKVFDVERYLFHTDVKCEIAWAVCENEDNLNNSAKNFLLGGTNKISAISFYTEEIFSEREIEENKNNLLIKNNYAEYLKIEKDEKKQFRLIEKLLREKNEQIEDIIKNMKNISNLLIKNKQIKSTKTFNNILTLGKIEHKQKGELVCILDKHKHSVREIVRRME